MSKRSSADSRPSILQWPLGWFLELPPQIKVMLIGVVAMGIILMLLPKSLFNSFNCDIQNLPQNYRSSNGYFIDSQVIVVGPKNEVDTVIGTPAPPTTQEPPTIQAPPTTSVPSTASVPPVTLQALGTPSPTAAGASPTATSTVGEPNRVILNLLEGCDLSYLNTRKVAASNSTVETRQLVMRLYEIPENNKKVEDVIADIDAAAREIQADISADPNYLTRLSDSSTDPCIRTSDGGSGGGHPFGDPGIADPAIARDAFMSQWAFGSQGINLPPSTDLTGRRVRVGVFDTSPYRIDLPFFKWIASALPSPLWFTNWDAGGTTMMSNHGLFVAELIHGIAPKSHIQLIRVLNEDGCGELWALNKGLEDYTSRMSAWTESLDKTVINMSLGIHVANPEEDNNTGSEQDNSNSPENDSGPDDEENDKALEVNSEENEDLETLKRLITKAEEMGAIIVAASGNASSPTLEEPDRPVQDMEIPASYDNVYGVAATNQDRTRSCYSNKGDLAAPGGEGGRVNVKKPNGPPEEQPCKSKASTWNTGLNPCPDQTVADIANCQYFLISLARTRYGPQYVLWSGTSFAAPLVSGLAALAYEEGERDQVHCLIEEGGSVKQAGLSTLDDEMGWGFINVAESLSPTVLSRCGVTP